ncbi:uncharacterized protein FIBRA_08507 [Fibroporia radiculosa]|uniref:AB hydrolase-1 domain-containing protein n=1 Tax=Fibroporia radiculosa TaxID=599839 RepID=J4I2V3_9APHY|nr:uncharacterized protein FIBRA_08507 [Fibroporia radiculosa]CCM06257.1 predicted protein [Fibroporia radiculosa]
MQSLVVDDNGTQLAYIDRGPPKTDAATYQTVFILHGLGFTAAVYRRLIAKAPEHGLRVVAINRRDYPGSSPLSPLDQAALVGTDDEKSSFLSARALEIWSFIIRFIKQYNPPPLSNGGRSGGVGLMGWSLGNAFTLSTISTIHSLPVGSQHFIKDYLRVLIIHEPPMSALGRPNLPKHWMPILDITIPAEERHDMWLICVSAYFKHGDLSKRDPDLL